MIYRIGRIVGLSIFSVLILIPVLVVVFGSFKTDLELMTKPLSLPESWSFTNYRTLLEGGQIGSNFKNSVIVTIASVVTTLFISSLASFGIARIVNVSGRFLFVLFSMGLAIPAATSIIGIYESISLLLLQELRLKKEISEDDWINLQHSFLSNHSYFTKTANATRNTAKAKLLASIKKNLKK